MIKDLVSIIIPIYNSKKYIKACLDSIENQTYQNYEVVLVNDGSTDDTLSILEEYISKDKRYILINQINQGVSIARNTGIKNSQGEYIVFIDSDDLVKESYIENLVKKIVSYDVDVVYQNFSEFYKNKTNRKPARLSTGKYTFNDVKDKFVDDGTLTGILLGSACSAIYKTKILIDNTLLFNSNLSFNEDGVFNIELMNTIESFYYDAEDGGYLYRYHTNSSSKKVSNQIKTQKATNYIKNISFLNSVDNLNTQIKTRYIAEVFWTLLSICSPKNSDTNSNIIKNVKDLLISINPQDYELLNLKQTNRLKRIIISMMMKKKSKRIFFLLRYIYPIYKKVVV